MPPLGWRKAKDGKKPDNAQPQKRAAKSTSKVAGEASNDDGGTTKDGSNIQFDSGSFCMAKIAGYPYWPSVVYNNVKVWRVL